MPFILDLAPGIRSYCVMAWLNVSSYDTYRYNDGIMFSFNEIEM